MKLSQLKKIALILGTAALLQGCAATLVGGAAAGTKVATDPARWVRRSMMKR